MNTFRHVNDLGYVYNMYGHIGFYRAGEQSLTKPRRKRFSKRKFSWAVRYLLSYVL